MTTAFAPGGTGAPVMISIASPRRSVPCEQSPRAHLTRYPQRPRHVFEMHGEAVAHGTVEWWIVAVGNGIFGQHAPAAFVQRDAFHRRRHRFRTDFAHNHVTLRP